ncbi:hypothetical protein COHA_009563 [Chlorella ohadii]|uniref:Endonuclease/exonuclease/phosphatase domain-containing protein n=1 Tax=Chlorella ohadii TaxID=2649997 RepID=A0AAD5DEK4_9CHLO|nr:hypothetical protein COHA_009563 [Chlorella ohadii]
MDPTSSIETALSCAANQCCPLFRGYRDCLDRQLFEERMLEVGREVARNEFPDVILLQEVSARTLGLLGRQPWLADYHRSPLPADIGRCCTVILLRKDRMRTPPDRRKVQWLQPHALKLNDTFLPQANCLQDRVRPPPGHREVQWLEPYVLKLNDDRGDDAAFERDVKSVRCSILGRPVRISTAHLIHYEGGRRQAQEIFDWLSDQDVLNKGLDQDHVLGAAHCCPIGLLVSHASSVGPPTSGDFNWHYKHGMPLPAGWVDVWSELTRDAGQTWSSLARLGKDCGRVSAPARLDRVCAKLQSFRPIQIDNSTGSQPIEGAVRLRRTKARRGQPQEIPAYASDHRGM